MLAYIIYDKENDKKNNKQQNKVKEKMVDEMLPGLIGKECEIDFKHWLIYIADDSSLKGIIKDVDEQWVVVETTKKKQPCLKVIKKSLIANIKEIQS